jgi:hypothetical protein
MLLCCCCIELGGGGGDRHCRSKRRRYALVQRDGVTTSRLLVPAIEPPRETLSLSSVLARVFLPDARESQLSRCGHLHELPLSKKLDVGRAKDLLNYVKHTLIAGALEQRGRILAANEPPAT